MSQSDPLSFLSAANPDYIAALYAKYAKNPDSVDESWSTLFSGLGDEAKQILAELQGASWKPSPQKLAAVLSTPANTDETVKPAAKESKTAAPTVADDKAIADSLRAFLLIRSYQLYGHLQANLDPLGLAPKKYTSDLDPKTYGFTEADYDRPIYLGRVALDIERAPLRKIIEKLNIIYCGNVGLEFMHLQIPEQRQWLQDIFEHTQRRLTFSAEEKKYFLQRLTAAEGFETFAQLKFTSTKRFGIEGGESVIAAIEEALETSAAAGVKEVNIGMAHRGRLNVLTNVMGKPFTAMFSEFAGGASKPDDVRGSSDVKYHLGSSSDRDFNGHKVHLSLAPNPSHLEFIDPVVVGRVRAKQAMRKDSARNEVMAMLIHGDAALAGQGVVPEVLMMSQLPGYGIGGTLHIVINNQVGFTTSPAYTRSGDYCTDIAKIVRAPIFHVNGDDIEAVARMANIAAQFRQKFKRDVFIDVICYRRRGHNEADEPAFTQPLMYKAIHDKKSARTLYAEQLVREGVMTQEETDKMSADWMAYLEKEYAAAVNYKPVADMLEGSWKGLALASGDDRRGKTAITEEAAQKIGHALTTVPEGFDINSKIARQLEAKKEMFRTGEGFDWATAEALAFGTLVDEGFPVRLSGQDCGRGTFSHRHAVLTDQTTENRYVPLSNISKDQATFEVHDSPLSELAVMGFEYGYSMAAPKALVMWEGQFGDFVNGAQVIIDQFICSGETKWLRMSGLVLMLPHGFEGQGPEHSSGRLERFLQLSAEDNWQVVNCSTPANYFHVLRRQLHRDFRKPLIIMTPKSLLRHKLCVSPLSMMTGSETFHRVLPDDKQLKKVKRVVLCSGKVYYDLLEAREKEKIDNVALVRLEQFYPFPARSLGVQLNLYPDAEVIWCQEEPENQGAWHFLDRRIEGVLKDINHKSQRPVYVGREAAAAPATGSHKQHVKEQETLIKQALTL